MKLNWGTGIAITIAVFVLISFAFLYYAFQQKINLVQDNYYEDEIKYQAQMEKVNRSKKLPEKLFVKIENQELSFQFPSMFLGREISGEIMLYRPSNRNRDLFIDIMPDSNNLQIYSTEKILPGMWKVKVDWMVDSISYFDEKIIMVN